MVWFNDALSRMAIWSFCKGWRIPFSLLKITPHLVTRGCYLRTCCSPILRGMKPRLFVIRSAIWKLSDSFSPSLIWAFFKVCSHQVFHILFSQTIQFLNVLEPHMIRECHFNNFTFLILWEYCRHSERRPNYSNRVKIYFLNIEIFNVKINIFSNPKCLRFLALWGIKKATQSS